MFELKYEKQSVDRFTFISDENIRMILRKVSEEKNVEYISVNCMDIINGYSVIVAKNEKTAEIISNAIGLKFENLKAKTNELVSRKEIVKVMRNIYSK